MTEQQIFIEALETPDPVNRGRFLANACGNDDQLRRRIEKLIRDAGEVGSFLEPPAVAVDADVNATLDQPSPVPRAKQIGPYKIREKIAEGGMGAVYVAEQTHPVRRKVALKVIKPGMAGPNVVARFEAERQALAMMDHPNIARVLDGGATEDGLPYFVMELVQGLPITEYCDKKRLTTDERLKLFIDVCRAVQHAHQKGIIHRDLKPSNIMVAEIDGKAVPKVIDFGVAKALHQKLTDQTVYTEFAQVLGTPLYMSPEQAGLGVIDIDTRSDVYSLGVVLYELLTGETPFDREQLKKVTFDEMRRIIREDEPKRPSAMVNTMLMEAQSTVAVHRSIDTKKLSQTLAGELDWLVMKALDKDRERRYESASDLGADVERYLEGDPVQACPPSTTYLLRKFASRNQGLVRFATVIAALLIVASGLLWNERSQTLTALAGETAQREQSNANLAAALDAVNTLLEHVSNPQLVEIPQAQAIRERMLSDALAFYEQFKSSTGDTAELRYRAAMTRLDLGDLTLDFRQWDAAIPIFDQASGELETLVKSFPQQTRYRAGWARALGGKAHAITGTNDRSSPELITGIGLHVKEKAEYERLFTLDPANRKVYQHAMIESDLRRANTFRRIDDHAKASSIISPIRETLRGESPTVNSAEYDLLVGLTEGLARALEQHEPDHAKTLFQELLQLCRAIETQTASRKTRQQQMRSLGHAVRFLYNNELSIAAAKALADESIALASQLSRDYPNVAQYDLFVHIQCNTYFLFLRRELELARKKGDQALVEERSVELARFVDRVALDESLHQFRAKTQMSDPDAVHLLTASITRFPKEYVYYNLRGALYRSMEEYELAMADFDRAIEWLPRDRLYPFTPLIRPHYGRGTVFFARKEFNRAIEDYSRQLEIFGYDYHVYRKRAAAYFQLGKYDECLADLRDGIPRFPGVWTGSAASGLTAIQPSLVAACPNVAFRDAYLRLVDEVVEHDERSLESLAKRAAILFAFGEFERATLDLDSILESKPNASSISYCAQTLNNISWAMVSPTDTDTASATKAIKLATKATELASDQASYWNTLGVAQYRAGAFTDAVKSFTNSQELSEASGAYDAIFLAMAHWQLDDHEEARRWLTNAVEWADDETSQDEEFQRFEAEAEALGISQQ